MTSMAQINPEVKRGTLVEILKYILGIPENTYIEPFLICYPKWVSTEKLFDCLEGLASPMSCGLYPQLAPFLNYWINSHLGISIAEHLTNPAKEGTQDRLASKILTITNNLFLAGYEEEANRLKLTMIRINRDLTKRPKIADPIKSAVEHPKGPLKLSTVLSRKVAEQLTLLESRMYRTIQMAELYSRGWTKSNKERDAPHICAMINHSTKVSHWAASLILNQREENNRIRAVQRVITIAQYCYELRNYNAVMEILGGLSMWSVARILKGMKIPKRYVSKMKNFQSIFDRQKNWKNYREALVKDREAGLPVLPYLGLFLTDIVFLEEGNTDYCESKDIINFEKVTLLGSQLIYFQGFQKISFNNLVKEKENTILKYLTNLPSFTEEKLEKLSNEIKPIPEELKSKEIKAKIDIDWDSAEVSTEEDSWSEDAVSENDFEELSTTSLSDDLYREFFIEDMEPQQHRTK